MSNFGERLKQIRTERGITQEKMAKMVSMSVSEIQRIERRGYRPRLANAKKFALALDIELKELLGNDYEQTRISQKRH